MKKILLLLAVCFLCTQVYGQTLSNCNSNITTTFNGNSFNVQVYILNSQMMIIDTMNCKINTNGQVNNSSINCNLAPYAGANVYFVYRLCNGNSTNCTDCLYTNQGQVIGVLGADLIEFKGSFNNRVNEITWITINEEDVERFELSWMDEQGAWTVINEQPSKHLNNQASYVFLDSEFTRNSYNYYQLIEVDYSGKRNILETIVVDNRDSSYNRLLYVTNTLGQRVSYEERGLLIEHYQDGTIKKVMR